jgi:hypothetical protein
MKKSATYLYCLVQSKKEPSLAGVPPGLPGIQTPRALAAGNSLWLIAGDAPLSQYGAEPIEAGLEDLDWVAQCAVAHERVIEHFTAPAVPMKLFTLFSSDERAVAHIAAARKTLTAAIRRIAGCKEWGVRIRFEGSRTGSKPVRASTVSGMTSGIAFLLSKKSARDQELKLAEQALAGAQAAYRALSRHAKDAKRLAIVKGEGHAGSRVLLNGAFLVPSGRTRSFQKTVEQFTAKLAGTCSVVVTGPWPPYNFMEKSK